MDGNYISRVVLREPVPKDSYLAALPAVRSLGRESLPLDRAVTFLVGENGSGKSTLLEGIAVAAGFNAEGGTRNFNFATRATHSPLHEYLTLHKRRYPKDGFFLRAESFYNTASYVDEVGATGSYGGESLHHQSHGESFLSLVEHRFGGRGLYILDEPEAALSPSRLLTLLAHIHRLVKADSQLIIATHSPILMAFPGAQLYWLSQDGIAETAYRDTEHYQITRRFLDAPEKMLSYLLED